MGDRTRHPYPSLVLLAGLIVAAVAVGALLVHLGDTNRDGETLDQRSEVRARPAGSNAPWPERESAGMPVGFSRDEKGAAEAAVAYATASQRWLYFTDEEIHAAIEQIATPSAAPGLAEAAITDVAAAREGLSASTGRVWWLVRPLAWELEHHDDSRARVSVWVVTVLSAMEVAAPQAEWMTVTLDLAWIDGDWRVEAVRDGPGPTPALGPNDRPWDAQPFDDTLSGYTRLDGEPVR